MSGRRGKLRLTINEARLNGAALNLDKAAAFAIVDFGGTQPLNRTRTTLPGNSSGYLNPTWQEEFEYQLTGAENQITVMVYHKGKMEQEFFLGRLILPLGSLLGQQKAAAWYQLSNETNVGDIAVTTHFVEENAPLLNALPVATAHARQLAPIQTNQVMLSQGPPSYDDLSFGSAAKTSTSAAAPPARLQSFSSSSTEAPHPASLSKPAFSPLLSEKATQQAISNEKVTTMQMSTCYGPKLSDTNQFEDVPTLVSRVVIYTDGKHVFGLQVEGRDGNVGDRHQREQGPFGYSIFELQPKEFITTVKGGEEDNGIVYLQFVTNMGTKKHFGGRQDMGSPFKIYIPYGNAVVGFHGGVGARLHNIGVLSAPGYL